MGLLTKIKNDKLEVSVENFKAALWELKDEGGYHYLSDLTVVDNLPQTPRFHVVYVLTNMKDAKRVILKVPLSSENPRILTVTDIWSGANWMEREAYDMFGVIFEGHPHLKRIYAAAHQSWSGHGTEDYPLRKDYNIIQRPGDDKTEKNEKW
ncbi:MAG: NADH-quinone oxidoreductase subunit C [Deltaproteobacteria bacterium]|nr:NADH-quinone oxidoreductase subunit C [Deltaproteobacteria bacterium]